MEELVENFVKYVRDFEKDQYDVYQFKLWRSGPRQLHYDQNWLDDYRITISMTTILRFELMM